MTKLATGSDHNPKAVSIVFPPIPHPARPVITGNRLKAIADPWRHFFIGTSITRPDENQHRDHRDHDETNPSEQQHEDKRRQEQQPGTHHIDPAGPMLGTCRTDGQNNRGRGSGYEQRSHLYFRHRAHAHALGLALAAQERKLAIPNTHPYGVNATAIHAPRANLLAYRRCKTVMSTSEDKSPE